MRKLILFSSFLLSKGYIIATEGKQASFAGKRNKKKQWKIEPKNVKIARSPVLNTVPGT